MNDSINIAECNARFEGDFFIVRVGDIDAPEIYREHETYCHIRDAWRILMSGRPAGWKNIKTLVTLRQALRERFAQGMPLEMPEAGCSKAALNEFLRQARAHDAVHHGSVTF